MIDFDKAYILGLLVGGGSVSKNTFIINLPFDKWGMDAANMNTLAKDILTKISKKFQKCYGFPVGYEIANKKWLIKPIDEVKLVEIVQDLQALELPYHGILLNSADLSKVKEVMKDSLLAETFLSGVFDTRASLAKSHRRFSDEAPVVSIEIPGSTENFKFVVQLCSWLTDLGSITDQILFNHPSQHAASDPTYKGWKKGFKIRFLVRSFLAKHSFALQAKAFDIAKLEKYQLKSSQPPCAVRKPKMPSAVSIHEDIGSTSLPIEVRNKLFFHYHHFCAVLGCPHAPLQHIREIVENYENLISVLPRLMKGEVKPLRVEYDEIRSHYFSDYQIVSKNYTVKELLKENYFEKYSDLEVGLAYLFSVELNGKRHIGSKDDILEIAKNQTVKLLLPNSLLDAPILIENNENNRSIIVSATTGKFNKEMIDSKIEITGLSVKIR